MNRPLDALRIEGVRAGYGGTIVLDGIDLAVRPGELVGIVGPSGSGKTTLLRLLTGELGALLGNVAVFDRLVHQGQPSPLVGYVPQLDSTDPAFPVTAEHVVLQGLMATTSWRPWWGRPERAKAAAMLERLGLGGLGHRRLDELSGGQRQRVLLGRALVGGSRLVVLDEPTSGIDLGGRAEVLGLLHDLRADGITVLLTTHDLTWVAAQLPRIVCLHRGIVADGPPVDVLTPEVLSATFGARIRVVHDGDAILLTDADPPPTAPAGQTAGPDGRGRVPA